MELPTLTLREAEIIALSYLLGGFTLLLSNRILCLLSGRKA